jgi:hypothetical protein
MPLILRTTTRKGNGPPPALVFLILPFKACGEAGLASSSFVFPIGPAPTPNPGERVPVQHSKGMEDAYGSEG